MGDLLTVAFSGLSSGAIYALIALGFVVVYKSTKVLNFTHGMLVVLAAYTSWSLISWTPLPIWLSIILTFAISMGFAMGIERVFMRPLVGQPILANIMLTLALMVGLKALTQVIWGGFSRRYPVPILPTGVWSLGGTDLPLSKISILMMALILILALVVYFNYTRSGLAMKVTSEDHIIAQSVGVKISQVFSTAWALAGITATFGGIALGSTMLINPDLEILGLKALAVMLLGGLESFGGAIIGGLLIGLAEAIAGGYLSGFIGGAIMETFPFMLMILILIIRPYGLFGWVKVERV